MTTEIITFSDPQARIIAEVCRLFHVESEHCGSLESYADHVCNFVVPHAAISPLDDLDEQYQDGSVFMRVLISLS